MFRIGDFSRLARVSCRLLRYYEQIGLLRPMQTDRENGYRYYSAAQLPRLNRILVLKELGLSLEEIAHVIDANPAAAELRALLTRHRTEQEHRLAEEAARLRRIESRLMQIETENDPWGDDVMIRTEPARRFLCIRLAIASFAEAKKRLQEVHAAVTRRVPASRLLHLAALAHPEQFEPDSLDVEFGFFVDDGVDLAVPFGDNALRVRELPVEKAMATCVRTGPPEVAHLVTGRVARFLEHNGYRLAGPNREVFLEPPQFERMETSVVEMQFPATRA